MKKTRMAVLAALVLGLVLVAGCAMATGFQVRYIALYIPEGATSLDQCQAISMYDQFEQDNFLDAAALQTLYDSVTSGQIWKDYSDGAVRDSKTYQKAYYKLKDNVAEVQKKVFEDWKNGNDNNADYVWGDSLSGKTVASIDVYFVVTSNTKIVNIDYKSGSDIFLDYTGKQAEVSKVTVNSEELEVGSDKHCTLTWYDKIGNEIPTPTAIGLYFVEATGTGEKYKGTKCTGTSNYIQVEIKGVTLTEDNITVADTPYTGSAVSPEITFGSDVKLVKDTDYKIISCTGNEHVGEATIKVEGIGNYTGEVIKSFKVTYAMKVDQNQFFTYGEDGKIYPVVTNDPKDGENTPTFTYKLDSFKAFGQTEAGNPEGKDSYIYIQPGWLGRITYTVTALNADNEAWGTIEERKLYVYTSMSAEEVGVKTTETVASFTWEKKDNSVVSYNLYLDGVKLEEVPAKETNTYGLSQLGAGSAHVLGIQPVYELSDENVPDMPITKVGFTTQATVGDEVAVESFRVTLNGKGKNLNGSTLKLKLGKKQKLKVGGFKPVNATDIRVRWRSSNTSVCTVKNGKLVAKKTGTATITVTARDGFGAKVSFKVKVVK